MSSPTLTVIVVTWNNEADVRACFGALGRPPAGWRVQLVDNASTDRTVAVVREFFPWIEVLTNRRNEGFARASNLALRTSDTDFVLLLNPDTECDASSVRGALGWMEAHPRVGVVGVRLLDADGRVQPSSFRFPSPGTNLLQLSGAYRLLPRRSRAHLLLGSNWDHSDARPVDWLLGAFLLARGSALKRVGLLAEEYALFGEDMDWCWRFWKAGLEVWHEPAVRVLHRGGRSARRLSSRRRTELALSGKYRFCASRYGRGAARFVQATDLLAFATRFLVGMARPRARRENQAWYADGFRAAARALRRPLFETEVLEQ